MSSTDAPKLKLKITKSDYALTVQVLEQDERFVSKLGMSTKRYLASNGFEVESSLQPTLYMNCVSLRGETKSGNDFVASFTFDSKGERDEYLRKMEDALREWAEKAPEFQVPATCRCTCDCPCAKPKTDEKDEYTFTV